MAWNHPAPVVDEPSKGRKGGRNFFLKCGIPILLVLSGVVLGVYFFASSESDGTEETTSTNRGRIKSVTPAKGPKTLEAQQPVKNQQRQTNRTEKAEKQQPEKPSGIDEFGVNTNGAIVLRRKQRGYKTCVEQALNWMFNCEVGEMPPPPPWGIPQGELKNIIEIIRRDPKIEEGESEESIYRKESVRYAKNELLSFINSGAQPEDFMRYYYNQLRIAHDKRNDAIAAVMKAYNEEDGETAREMYFKVNEMLQKEGIKKVVLSEDVLDDLDIKEDE